MTNHRNNIRLWLRTALATGLISAVLLLLLLSQQQHGAEAASARLNGHQVTKQQNKYFLNEFCDLRSKSLRSPKKFKNNEINSVYLTSKNTLSTVRVVPQKQVPSSISFGFGGTQSPFEQQKSIVGNNQTSLDQTKSLNCSIVVVGPKSHGLLVTVKSIGLPKNLTKLGIILNHDSPHAQHIHLEGETKSAHYLLTEQNSSSIAINLQTFQPIDWSKVSFDILFTVYKKSNGTTGCPNQKWFDCGDNICVPSSSVCDNNLNCPNGSDELTFYHCYSPLFMSIAASTTLALSILVIIVVVLIIVKRRRINGLGGGRRQPLSLSDNALTTAEGDLMVNDSKLDLTQTDNHHHHANHNQQDRTNNSYLASNLYLNGFENPVWQNNGTLTKQQSNKK